MAPAFLLGAVAAGITVPASGAAALGETYRTDPALVGIAAPAPSRALLLGSAVVSLLLSCVAPVAGWTPESGFLLAPLLAMVVLTDGAGRVIPDQLTAAIAAVGLVLAALGLGMSLVSALTGAALVGGVMLGIRAVAVRRHGEGALGLGDVKMLAACAAAIPLFDLGLALILTAPIGLAVVGLSKPARRGAEPPALPFGALFVLGLVATLARHAHFSLLP